MAPRRALGQGMTTAASDIGGFIRSQRERTGLGSPARRPGWCQQSVSEPRWNVGA